MDAARRRTASARRCSGSTWHLVGRHSDPPPLTKHLTEQVLTPTLGRAVLCAPLLRAVAAILQQQAQGAGVRLLLVTLPLHYRYSTVTFTC